MEILDTNGSLMTLVPRTIFSRESKTPNYFIEILLGNNFT